MHNTKLKTWFKTSLVTVLWALPLAALAQSLDLGLEYGELTGLGTKDLRETAASLINVALSLLGIIAVVIVLAGGFFWMTAGGNEERLEKAKQLIFGGVIGLAIILSAYAIVLFVVDKLTEATN